MVSYGFGTSQCRSDYESPEKHQAACQKLWGNYDESQETLRVFGSVGQCHGAPSTVGNYLARLKSVRQPDKKFGQSASNIGAQKTNTHIYMPMPAMLRAWQSTIQHADMSGIMLRNMPAHQGCLGWTSTYCTGTMIKTLNIPWLEEGPL
jgi:hypothetical protein